MGNVCMRINLISYNGILQPVAFMPWKVSEKCFVESNLVGDLNNCVGRLTIVSKLNSICFKSFDSIELTAAAWKLNLMIQVAITIKSWEKNLWK